MAVSLSNQTRKKTLKLEIFFVLFATIFALGQRAEAQTVALLESQSSAEADKPLSEKSPELEGIGIDEKLGDRIDLSLQVTDESGKLVPLKSFFDGKKPVILSLVYFSCPGLCNYHLNGLTTGLKKMEWSPGQNFEVIALSFDAKETAEVGSRKKETYLKLYDRAGTERGWHFVTANEDVIKKITNSIGFRYKWDEKNKEWIHASAATILSPEGKISRYLHGIIFDPRDVKLALLDAMDGKTVSLGDKLISYCFQYDPHKSKYSLMSLRLVQFGGGFFLMLLFLILIPFYLRSKYQRTKLAPK